MSYEKRIFSQMYLKEVLRMNWRFRADLETKLAGLKKGHRILDIRCGPGLELKIIRKKVGRTGEIVYINGNKFFLKYAKKFCNYNNICFIQGNTLDSAKLIKKYYGEDKKFNHIIFSWLLISPESLPRFIEDINELLVKKGTFTFSRGGDDFGHPFTKLFNERLQENLFEIVKAEHPKLRKNFLLNLRFNIDNIAKKDITNTSLGDIKFMKRFGFRIKKAKEIIWPMTLEKRLEFYKNPLRNSYIGSFSIRERYRLIKKAFHTTLKELGNKKLQMHRCYSTFQKNN